MKPDFEDAAFRLGFLQLQRGEFASAVDSFETCLKKRKDWVEALLNLGLACWKFEDLDAATETFNRVLALQPKNIDALRALIAIAIERKDHKRAWDLLQKLNALGDRSRRAVLQPRSAAASRPAKTNSPPNATRSRSTRSRISRKRC